MLTQVGTPGLARPSSQNSGLEAALKSALPAAVRVLAELVALPNLVSDPVQIQANARHLAALLERRGFKVTMLPTPSGRPVVRADLDLGRPKTIVLYSHYDGVSVNPATWHSPPYAAVLRKHWTPEAPDWTTAALSEVAHWQPEWRLFGRSVADSKNAIVAILAALDALKAAAIAPGANLRLLLDGEEENESPGLADALRASPGALEGDLLICASGETHQSGDTTVSLGVRGILMFEIELKTATTELHSGHFGNFGRNAGTELARLIAGLKSEDGGVAVAGFSEAAQPLTASERAAMARMPASEREVRARFGMAAPERSGSLQELINTPTLNLRGIEAGGIGPDGRNVLLSTAKAEFDVRLVQGMDPDQVITDVRNHLTAAGYDLENEPVPGKASASRGYVRVRKIAGFPAARTPLDDPRIARMLRLLEAADDGPILVQPTDGGSLDFGVFKNAGLPIATLPISNSDCNQHTSDENLRLGHLDRGIRQFAAILQWQD